MLRKTDLLASTIFLACLLLPAFAFAQVEGLEKAQTPIAEVTTASEKSALPYVVRAVLTNVRSIQPTGSVIDTNNLAAERFLRLIMRADGQASASDGSQSIPELEGSFSILNIAFVSAEERERRDAMDLLDKCGRVALLATVRPDQWKLVIVLFSSNIGGTSLNHETGWLHLRLLPGDELRCDLIRLDS